MLPRMQTTARLAPFIERSSLSSLLAATGLDSRSGTQRGVCAGHVIRQGGYLVHIQRAKFPPGLQVVDRVNAYCGRWSRRPDQASRAPPPAVCCHD